MLRFPKAPVVEAVVEEGTKKEVEEEIEAVPAVKAGIAILQEKEGTKNQVAVVQAIQEKEGVNVKVISFS